MAAGVVVTAWPGGTAGSMTDRPCMPPVSDVTTTLPSEARANPMGKRKTWYWSPAGRMHQPAGVVAAAPQRSAGRAEGPECLPEPDGLPPGLDPASWAGAEAPPVRARKRLALAPDGERPPPPAVAERTAAAALTVRPATRSAARTAAVDRRDGMRVMPGRSAARWTTVEARFAVVER